jgi:hypothetical protein
MAENAVMLTPAEAQEMMHVVFVQISVLQYTVN